MMTEVDYNSLDEEPPSAARNPHEKRKEESLSDLILSPTPQRDGLTKTLGTDGIFVLEYDDESEKEPPPQGRGTESLGSMHLNPEPLLEPAENGKYIEARTTLRGPVNRSELEAVKGEGFKVDASSDSSFSSSSGGEEEEEEEEEGQSPSERQRVIDNSATVSSNLRRAVLVKQSEEYETDTDRLIRKKKSYRKRTDGVVSKRFFSSSEEPLFKTGRRDVAYETEYKYKLFVYMSGDPDVFWYCYEHNCFYHGIRSISDGSGHVAFLQVIRIPVANFHRRKPFTSGSGGDITPRRAGIFQGISRRNLAEAPRKRVSKKHGQPMYRAPWSPDRRGRGKHYEDPVRNTPIRSYDEPCLHGGIDSDEDIDQVLEREASEEDEDEEEEDDVDEPFEEWYGINDGRAIHAAYFSRRRKELSLDVRKFLSCTRSSSGVTRYFGLCSYIPSFSVAREGGMTRHELNKLVQRAMSNSYGGLIDLRESQVNSHRGKFKKLSGSTRSENPFSRHSGGDRGFKKEADYLIKKDIYWIENTSVTEKPVILKDVVIPPGSNPVDIHLSIGKR